MLDIFRITRHLLEIFFILCLQVPISTSMHFIYQVILLCLQICEMVLKLASLYKAMIIVSWNGKGELSSILI
jgi:hypothetical protein